MSEWLWDIINSVVSGLATTLSAALLLYLYNLIRNYKLASSIRTAIQKKSQLTAEGNYRGKTKYKSAGIKINNPFEISFVIRTVWAQTGDKNNETRCLLTYAGPEFQYDLLPLASKNSNPYDFVTLMPFTNGRWIIEAEGIHEIYKQKHFNKLNVYVEYQTVFGSPKVIQVDVIDPRILNVINEMLDEANATVAV